MTPHTLQQAISGIDEDLIARADASARAYRWRRQVAYRILSIAAVIAVICCGFMWGRNDAVPPSDVAMSGVRALAEPTYPSKSVHQQMRQSYFGTGDELDSLLKATLPVILADDTHSNRVYSPFSLYMALAMTAETTEGNTRAQILDLLGVDTIDTLRTQTQRLWMANYCDSDKIISIPASSLWMNDTLPFRQQTLDVLAEQYFASSYQGEMGSSELNTALRQWINTQTKDLLKDQTKGMSLKSSTAMALVNTLYFEAQWQEEFLVAETTDQPFHTATGDVICEFMHQTTKSSQYYWGDNFSAVGKELVSGHMWFVLPDEGVDVQQLLADDQVLSWLIDKEGWQNQKTVTVNWSMPKFEVDAQLSLNKPLESLGVKDCFSPALADFSPLLEEPVDESVFVSSVEQGTLVKVDEKGVIGGAYTMTIIDTDFTPPQDEIDFVLDRPFLFMVTGEDGSPLFVGIVQQP